MPELVTIKRYHGSKEECEAIYDWLRTFGYRIGAYKWRIDPDPDGDGWTAEAGIIG